MLLLIRRIVFQIFFYKKKEKNKIVFLGFSTHIDEEKILIQTHLNLIKKFPKLITLIMPRYIHRIPTLIKQFQKVFNINIPVYSENNFANQNLIFCTNKSNCDE